MTLYDDVLKTCGTCEFIDDKCCRATDKDVPGIVYRNDGINTCKVKEDGTVLSYMIDITYCPRRNNV